MRGKLFFRKRTVKEKTNLKELRKSGLSTREAWAKLSSGQRLREIDRARKGNAVKIYADNDSMVFFNVGGKQKKVSQIDRGKKDGFKREGYNELVPAEQEAYFETGKFEAPIITTSIIGTCTVVLVYVKDKHGSVKRAGVFHMQDRRGELKEFIKKVSQGDHVFIKAAGSMFSAEERVRAVSEELGELATLESTDFHGVRSKTIETIPMQGTMRMFKRRHRLKKDPKFKRQ